MLKKKCIDFINPFVWIRLRYASLTTNGGTFALSGVSPANVVEWVRTLNFLILIFLLGGCSVIKKSNSKQLPAFEDYVAHMTHPIKNIDDALAFFPRSVEQVACYEKYALELAKQELGVILSLKKEDRTFENTVSAYDAARTHFLSIKEVFSTLGCLSPDARIAEACQKVALNLRKHYIDFFMQPACFHAFCSYGARSKEKLDESQKYYFDQTVKTFKHYGLHLNDKKRSIVYETIKDIFSLEYVYRKNIENNQRHVLADRNALVGMSDHFISSLKKDGERFVLPCNKNMYEDVLRLCKVEKTRKAVYLAYKNRAYPENFDCLKQLLKQRDVLASSVGFNNFAALQLSDYMAQTPVHAASFLSHIQSTVKQKINIMDRALKKNLPNGMMLAKNNKFQPWDVLYARNYYGRTQLEADGDHLAVYFPLEKVLPRLCGMCGEMFNLTFTLIKPSWIWDQQVYVVEVREKTGLLLGYIFYDLFAQEGKKEKGSRKEVLCASYKNGVFFPALCIIVAALPVPKKGESFLLRRRNLKTLFHETGHALQSLLNKTSLISSFPENRQRDSSEFAAQLVTELGFEHEVLKKISCHYKTGQSIPDKLLQQRSRLFEFDVMRSLQETCFNSLMSLQLHQNAAYKDTQKVIRSLSHYSFSNVYFYSDVYPQTAFGHLATYGASYYGYLWSKKLLVDQVWKKIKQHGVLNKKIWQKLAHDLLGQSANADYQALVGGFLGSSFKKSLPA